MPRITCHFPITVVVRGTPSAADLEQLGHAVQEALADRLRLARRQGMGTGAGTVVADAAPAPGSRSPAEPVDRSRIRPSQGTYLVPSYQAHGALRSVELRQANPAGRDPAVLSDTELDTEYARTRQWLLEHRVVELPYASMTSYLQALEAELARRKEQTGTAPPPAAGVSTTGKPPPTTPPLGAPPSGAPFRVTSPGPSEPAGAGATGDQPYRITAAHAGGILGEREQAFALGQRGFRLLVTSVGPGAHGLTGSGFDSIAHNPTTGEIWLTDNKASGSLRTIQGSKATALGENLEASLAEAVGIVWGMRDFPERTGVLSRLESALGAVREGRMIPDELNVKLKVLSAGGYAGGAGGLPAQVEFEDVVGPEIRATRRQDIAQARAQRVPSGRPRSHEETETMRRRAGGVQSREPVPAPVTKVRFGGRVRAVGAGIAGIAALVLWNTLMDRISAAITQWFIQRETEKEFRKLEPVIAARLNDQVRVVAELQSRRPGTQLFGVVETLTTLLWVGEDEELGSMEVSLVGVSIGTERVERSERKREWVGNILWRAQQDVVRWTYSIELEPLSNDDLRDYLLEGIDTEESAVSASSATPEQRLASQRRRDELAERLRRLESP